MYVCVCVYMYLNIPTTIHQRILFLMQSLSQRQVGGGKRGYIPLYVIKHSFITIYFYFFFPTQWLFGTSFVFRGDRYVLVKKKKKTNRPRPEYDIIILASLTCIYTLVRVARLFLNEHGIILYNLFQRFVTVINI